MKEYQSRIMNLCMFGLFASGFVFMYVDQRSIALDQKTIALETHKLIAEHLLYQRSSIKSSQESQDKLYALTKSFAGHVWAENLKNEGRRLAFAYHFAEQTLKGDDKGNYKKLLKHGSEGIESYLSLERGFDVVKFTKLFAAENASFGFQQILAKHFPARTSTPTDDKATDKNKNDSEKAHLQLEKGEKSDE